MIELREHERIDELHRNGYKIIQNESAFCFGMDAVLLSGFATAKKGERVVDFCTGTGIIPILMEAKTEGSHFTGLEIQPQMAEMANRSVLLNELSERVEIICGDVCKASERFGKSTVDVVTCNPPYMNQNHGLKNPDEPKAIARHEVCLTFEDVAREAAAVLKPGGRFYLVHRPMRLVELIMTMKAHKLEPKRMKFVHPYVGEEANMVLIEAVYGGGAQMRIEKPLIVYEAPGKYTPEIYDIYGY
ncbi:MAG: tRNA1(Val) (adenine(37)-N6)-methyltransferase [Lachnospiraceae bacterium]|jgi:tRNA1(Val) A37 N6-methylase TrmN6|nr:tRNA1(Val) (adenine(37)-N6)-methyltransferase [Lachnospiraceae bacterium]